MGINYPSDNSIIGENGLKIVLLQRELYFCRWWNIIKRISLENEIMKLQNENFKNFKVSNSSFVI